MISKKFKFLMILGLMSAISLGAFAAPDSKNCKDDKSFCSPVFNKTKEDYMSKKRSLEDDLKLTQKQRTQLKAIRVEKARELEPLRKQMEAKRQEIKMIKLSRIAPRMQEEKIMQVEKDIATINKKILSVKQAKQKEFEKILTKDQLAQYKNIQKSDEAYRKKRQQKLKKEIKKNSGLK